MLLNDTVDSLNNGMRVEPKTRSLLNFGALTLYGYFDTIGVFGGFESKFKNYLKNTFQR